MSPLPSRFAATAADHARLGPAVARLGELLTHGDPLADDAVAALERDRAWALFERALARGIDDVAGAPGPLRALFAALDHRPAWLAKDALDRGGELLLRAGWFGGLALGVSLVHGYASPAGNKPLAFSGQLHQQTPRRLLETSRFVEATCVPGGLLRDAPGFAITARVRLMHAKVRRLLRASGRWDAAAWGEPINQHDMAATALLFSSAVIDTLTKLGMRFDAGEVDRYMQLWRYSSWLLGVDAEVLPASLPDALRLTEVIAATEGPPDDDSRALTRAFFAATKAPERASDAERRRAERLVRLGQGLMRGLLGEPLAKGLGVPPNELRHALVLVRAAVSRVESTREALPQFAREALDRKAIAAGRTYWTAITGVGLSPLAFAPPDALLGAPIAAAVAHTAA